MVGTEDLLVIVLWLSVAVVCLDLGFVLLVLSRRVIRHRYHRRRDAARPRFAANSQQVIASASHPNVAVERFGKIRGRAERDALCELLTSAFNDENRSRVTDLLWHLGYVQRWAEQAFGGRRARAIIQSFASGIPLPPQSAWRRRLKFITNLRYFAVSRAAAVQQLGRLSPEVANFFIEEAKHDPSPEVRTVNINAMVRSKDALVYLLPELAAAVEERNGIAVRTVKAAIVRAEVDDPNTLVNFIKHTDDRVRFLVVDCIREICAKPREAPLSAFNFPVAMYRIFLEELMCDTSVDVRARSAEVIRHFHDEASNAALRILMKDDNEFVRLHAVRACADAYYSSLVPEIAERITDPRWRVREAAVKTLTHLGTRGMRALAETFLATKDHYATEQIAEELQRSGAILEIIESLGAGYEPSRIATEVCRKMIALGKSSFLAEMLGKHESIEKRARLMDLLSMSKAPYTAAIMNWIAQKPNDPLAHEALARLSGRLAVSAEAGGNSK